MRIERTEPATGGETRTRREEIVPLFTSEEVEPEMYLDASGSESWEVKPPEGSAPSRWVVQTEAVRGFIAPFEVLDSQAAAEQSSGDDEKGGVYCYPFNHKFLPIGHGDDDGDLNSSNFDEKLSAFARHYGVPGGGTAIMTAVQAADKHYMAEFGPGGENERSRADRPVRARVVWTDGELKDAGAFAQYLADAEAAPGREHIGTRKSWDETWAVAILGYGDDHDATLLSYQALAKQHPYVHVYSFSEVANPAEIAEDMALAVVPTQA